MRRLGTEGWAGVAMLVVSVGVAAPTLFGAIEPIIARVWWVLLFCVFLVSLVTATAARTSAVLRYGGMAVAVISAWAVVLTAQSTGLLLILLVVTAATTVYVIPLWGSLVVIAANTGVVAAVTIPNTDGVESLILIGFYLLIQLASLLSTATLLREQRLRQELTVAHLELKSASILLSESARTAERLRISRELHDLIGHQLTVLTLELETARHLDATEARAHLDRADGVARNLLRDVRETVGHLRTEAPDLEIALRNMTDGLPGLDISIEVSSRMRVGEDESAALVRATQEIVTNTLRHAEAGELSIKIEADDNGVMLVARDDGRGYSKATLGNGLLGLKERFVELGGDVTVDGRAGFQVTARIPAS